MQVGLVSAKQAGCLQSRGNAGRVSAKQGQSSYVPDAQSCTAVKSMPASAAHGSAGSRGWTLLSTRDSRHLTNGNHTF